VAKKIRTICEVHRQIYDILINKNDPESVEIKKLLEAAYIMAKKMVWKLYEYRADKQLPSSDIFDYGNPEHLKKVIRKEIQRDLRNKKENVKSLNKYMDKYSEKYKSDLLKQITEEKIKIDKLLASGVNVLENEPKKSE
jgi:phosphate uptake regulator